MTPGLEETLDRTYRITVIVAVAMIASVLMYIGVVELLNRLAPASGPSVEAGTVELLRQVFRGLALVHFLALAESIAVYGLVLFLLSRDPIDFYYLLLVSLLSFVVVISMALAAIPADRPDSPRAEAGPDASLNQKKLGSY